VPLVCIGLALCAGLLFVNDAQAIDGNYSSPYASQYDSRSTAATIPNETWLGILMLLLNLSLAAVFVVRKRWRQAQQS
jgi:hypothetical protein